MTGALVISLYLLALTAFLGLDILGKLPATLATLVLAALGAMGGVVIVAALQVAGRDGGVLLHVAVLLGGAVIGAGLATVAKLAAELPRKRAS